MSWLITGGSSGIGAQLVDELVADDQDVIVWDIREPGNGAARFETVDLMDEQAIDAAAARVEGPLNALIHVAGLATLTSIADPDLTAKLRSTYELHVVALARMAQRFRAQLKAGGGSIVAVASAAMDVTYPGTIAYGSSKLALSRLTQQLSVELGEDGIRVNTVAPGAVATPMTRDFWSDPERSAGRRSIIPLGHQADPAAITSAIRFLASSAASYVTGETLWVDGGVRHGLFNQAVRDFAKSGG
jgi:NAD(P)-dependent dehydrogenase (short-subunit alcohol dehydrogenase family)